MKNDAQIHYCHMDVVRSTLSGCSHFASPDYFIIQEWIQHMNFFLDVILLQGLHVYRYKRSFLWVNSILLIVFHVTVLLQSLIF